jgi:hypothetical protein
MANPKPIIAGLIVVLVVSLGFNIYQYNTNLANTQKNEAASIKQEMLSQLMHTQNNINTKLTELDAIVKSACQRLSSTGITGAQADTVLSEIATSNPLIVSAATSDGKDVLVAVQPSNYSYIIGDDIGIQEQQLQMRQSMLPAMSNMIMLVQDFPSVVMVAPIFDSQDQFMGALNLVIQPSMLINQSIASDSTVYSMWAMQKNGTLIYDPDPEQQGKNLLTDPIYQDYPEVQAFARQVAEQQSGYGTYQYYIKNLDQSQNQVVAKEAYWVTVGTYGTEWRVVIWHALYQ